jgi:hypothetical protein
VKEERERDRESLILVQGAQSVVELTFFTGLPFWQKLRSLSPSYMYVKDGTASLREESNKESRIKGGSKKE